MRARLARIAKLIEGKGLERVGEPHVKHFEGRIWEMRLKGRSGMARISEMHKKWLKEPKYKKAYDALEEEFVLAGAVMDVRNRAGLTQEELARRMGTTQPVVARLESGRTRPSMRTLERLAEATGSRLLISFAPLEAKRPASR